MSESSVSIPYGSRPLTPTLREPSPLCRITWADGVRTLCHPRDLSDDWTDALKDRVERFTDSVWEITNELPRLMGVAMDGTRVLLAQVRPEARGNFRVQVVLQEGR